MEQMSQLLLGAYVKAYSGVISARQSLRGENGQGALEYIAIVIGLVVLVYAGYKFAGEGIQEKARCFVNKATMGAAADCPSSNATTP